MLKGSYVFTATGSDPSDGDYFIAGSFQADGAGKITNGVEDLNLGSGVDTGVAFTGAYTVDSAGNATITLSDGSGIPTFFNVALAGGSSFTITNFDGTGSGTLQAQSVSGFSPNGNFTFTLSGEGQGTVAASGAFTNAGVITAGTEKYTDGTLSLNIAALSGFLGPAFEGGRGVATIGSNEFSYYVVSQNQIILAGLEEATLLHGTASRQ